MATLIPSGEGFLAAYLNSNLLWFTYLNVSAQIRGGFVRFFSNHLAEMPIPDFSEHQKASLTELVEASQARAEQRYALQQALVRRIPDLAPVGAEMKLSTKLKEWWTFPDFAAFRAEVRNYLKADIPLAERSAWEDWITHHKAEIARLTAEIKVNEAKINAIVYELFELTADEITLLEQSIA